MTIEPLAADVLAKAFAPAAADLLRFPASIRSWQCLPGVASQVGGSCVPSSFCALWILWNCNCYNALALVLANVLSATTRNC